MQDVISKTSNSSELHKYTDLSNSKKGTNLKEKWGKNPNFRLWLKGNCKLKCDQNGQTTTIRCLLVFKLPGINDTSTWLWMLDCVSILVFNPNPNGCAIYCMLKSYLMKI